MSWVNLATMGYTIRLRFTYQDKLQVQSETPIKWQPVALFPGVIRLKYRADHLPPSSVKVKNVTLYLHIPCIVLGTGTTIPLPL